MLLEIYYLEPRAHFTWCYSLDINHSILHYFEYELLHICFIYSYLFIS
uniref:Uncharacterized protein n=1 Tax=Anguilla anguilla TaxID=7936 RepID=A0A0E9WXK1_ANGAN